jgi:hypothetical protein
VPFCSGTQLPRVATETDEELRVLCDGFLLVYARQAAPLFAVPDTERRLLALVREITCGRFVTLDEACSAAIAVGERYGLVGEAATNTSRI